MKLFVLLKKAWLQQSRDYLSLIILIVTTPSLFMFYYFLTKGESPEFLPILILLSVLIVIFSSALIVSQEFESKSIIRMVLADIPFHLSLLGICFIQFILSLVSVIITLSLFYIFNIYDALILWKIFLCSSINLLTSIWIGASIGSISQQNFSTFAIASLVMFISLILSGALFPIQNQEIFHSEYFHFSLMDFIPSHSFLKLILEITNHQSINKDGLLLINILNSIFYFCVSIFIFHITQRKKVNDAQ